jgi:OOP family OmpA-OmpF porin
VSPFPVLHGILGLGLLLGLAGSGAALTLDFPGAARISASRSEPLTSHLLPLGPWADGRLPSRRVEGALDQTAWVLDAPGLTTLELLLPLRDQLREQGFAILWECDTANCGGFDFRFAVDVLPEPDMHVNLGDFRFLAAERPVAEGVETVSLLVSRSVSQGFVQVLEVSPAEPQDALGDDPATAGPAAPTQDAPAAPSDLARALQAEGSVALDDLTFASGAAQLAEGSYPSLEALADFLADNPLAVITLVGHTDASGDLAGNVALSKARATSVRDRLVGDYGAAAGRIRAEGVGYLAPRASNLTAEGRTLNRRVEAMLMVP